MNGYIEPPTIEAIIVEEEIIEAEPVLIDGNTDAEQKAISKTREWYFTDKAAKQFYVDEMDECEKLYKNKHWDLTGPGGIVLRTPEQQMNRPCSVENYAFALVEGVASEFAQDVEILDYPVNPDDRDAASVMTQLKQAIFYKNRVIDERIKFLRNFFVYGTGIWHTYWDPNWSGGRGPNRWQGDIRWKALHPKCLLPDARCTEDINEGNRCHKVIWMPKEGLEYLYPDRYHLIRGETMTTDDYIGDIDKDEMGITSGAPGGKDEMVPVVETWYTGEPLILDEDEESQGYGLHCIWWAGEVHSVYLKHANYIYFEPGETVKYPFILKQCYPRENSIWGMGEMIYLKTPQLILNKTAELIVEGNIYSSKGRTYYDANALSPLQERLLKEKGSLPGMYFAVRNINGIRTDYGQSVPASLPQETERLKRVMESIIGRFDVSQGRTPGSITAFRAITALAERAQVRLRIKEQSITSSYEEVGSYINRLINQFYTENRMFRICNDKEMQYGSFVRGDMLRFYNSATGTVTPLNNSILAAMPPEEADLFMAMNPNVEIFFPEFDVRCRVTTVAPTDRLYNIEVAKELLGLQVIDAQTFLEVVETGRWGSADIIAQRIEQMKMQQMQMEMMKPGAGSIGANPELMPAPQNAMPPMQVAPQGGMY